MGRVQSWATLVFHASLSVQSGRIIASKLPGWSFTALILCSDLFLRREKCVRSRWAWDKEATNSSELRKGGSDSEGHSQICVPAGKSTGLPCEPFHDSAARMFPSPWHCLGNCSCSSPNTQDSSSLASMWPGLNVWSLGRWGPSRLQRRLRPLSHS